MSRKPRGVMGDPLKVPVVKVRHETRKKTRNPTDTTLRNNRARVKREHALQVRVRLAEIQIKDLTKAVVGLTRMVTEVGFHLYRAGTFGGRVQPAGKKVHRG